MKTQIAYRPSTKLGVNKSFIAYSLILLFMLGVIGCGYTTHSAFVKKYKSVYVEPFINKVDITNESYTENKYRIYRPMLETDITRAVINRFLLDGNFKPVKEDVADLVLKGELVEFRKDPLRYNQNNDEVTEYRVNLIVNMSLWDKRNNKLLWEETRFTGDTSYFTTGYQAKTEQEAIEAALVDLSRRVVDRVVEEW
ncbi:MAG: hypothetical protein HZC15_07270 [Candidatus Omnitrophica bacterium]|nr:hypothetical protein [Candidatus Omnitrophota bacterium]